MERKSEQNNGKAEKTEDLGRGNSEKTPLIRAARDTAIPLVSPVRPTQASINNAPPNNPIPQSSWYNRISRLWNRHEIPTKILLGLNPLRSHITPLIDNSRLRRVNWTTCFTSGAGWVLHSLWPKVLFLLLVHDYTVYIAQSEDRYGANVGNILLGNAPNELSWASQFGSYFPTEFNYYLLPTLLPTTMLFFGISNIRRHFHLHKSLQPKELIDEENQVTVLRSYNSHFWNDTIRWLPPLSYYYVDMLAYLQFSLCFRQDQDHGQDQVYDDEVREIIFNDLQFIAKHHRSLARHYCLEALADIADQFSEDRIRNLPAEQKRLFGRMRTRALDTLHQEGADYLLWTLGQTKRGRTIGTIIKNVFLHTLFWITSLFVTFRWQLSLIFKFKDAVNYLVYKKACEALHRKWVMVPEIGNYDCIVCDYKSDANYVYYPDRYSAQGCINGFLSKNRTTDAIAKVVDEIPTDYEDVDFTHEDWPSWLQPNFTEALTPFTNRTTPIRKFDLSGRQYNSISNANLDPLCSIVDKVGIKQINLRNRGVGSQPIINLLKTLNGTIVEEIDISYTNSGDDVAEVLADIIPFTRVTKIIADGNFFSDYGFGRICKAAINSTLTYMSVAHNLFGADGIQSLTDSLPKTSLEYVNISDMDLSLADFSNFGKAVVATPSLKTLVMKGTNVNGDQMNAFTAEAKFSQLRSMDLSDTGLLGPDASQVITNMRNSTLSEIILRGLPIERQDLLQIVQDLSETNITVFDISDIQINSDDFCAFTLSLNQTKITTLIAEKNAIQDQGVNCLVEAILQPNNSITAIYLAENDITEQGGQQLARIAPKMKIMDLSRNPVGSVTAAAFDNALQQENQLEVLILAGTNIGSSGSTSIVNILTKAKKLHTLILNDNPDIGNAGGKQILQNLIEKIPNLEKLGDKFPTNDRRRSVAHATNTTAVNTLGLDKIGLQTDGGREACTVLKPAGIPLNKTQFQHNFIDPNQVDMDNCQVSSASRTLPFGISQINFLLKMRRALLENYYTENTAHDHINNMQPFVISDKSTINVNQHYSVFSVHNLSIAAIVFQYAYYYTSWLMPGNRKRTLNKDDVQKLHDYQERLRRLDQQHQLQKERSLAAQIPTMQDLFTAISKLRFDIIEQLEIVQGENKVSNNILQDMDNNLSQIDKHIHRIADLNKSLKKLRVKSERFERRLQQKGETGSVTLNRDLVSGKISQELINKSDINEYQKYEKKDNAIAANQTSLFSTIQQFWQFKVEKITQQQLPEQKHNGYLI